jgi:hypothetical protein
VSNALASLSQAFQQSRVALPARFVVVDWPVNQWRGLLVDVARHFVPPALLERTIVAMQVRVGAVAVAFAVCWHCTLKAPHQTLSSYLKSSSRSTHIKSNIHSDPSKKN